MSSLSEPENQITNKYGEGFEENPAIRETDISRSSQEILERGDQEIEWAVSRHEILKLVIDLTMSCRLSRESGQ